MSRLLGGKIDAQTRAGFQFYGTLPDIVPGHPCFEDVIAHRQIFQTIASCGVGLLEERSVEDENGAPHRVVNVAMDRHHAWFIENYRDRFLAFSVATQIESFGLRVRKNVVIGVVHIWEINDTADKDGHKIRRKSHVLLRHPPRRSGRDVSLRAEIPFQVDHCRRRIGRRHGNVRPRRVSLIEGIDGGRLRQLDRAFDYGLRGSKLRRQTKA